MEGQLSYKDTPREEKIMDAEIENVFNECYIPIAFVVTPLRERIFFSDERLMEVA